MVDAGEKPAGDVARLVPFFSHRYIVSAEHDCALVLSVVQTDVCLYGRDIADWAGIEFRGARSHRLATISADSLEPWTLFAGL